MKTLKLTDLEIHLIALVCLMVVFFLIHGNAFEAVPRLFDWVAGQAVSGLVNLEIQSIANQLLQGMAGK